MKRVFFICGLLLASLAIAAEKKEIKHRGFTIDGTKLAATENADAIFRATEEQIDIVCDVGLSDDAMKFLQTVDFALVPIGTIPRGSPGFYGGADRSVKVVANIVSTGHKPVLLHELMHAYHDRRVKDGFRNAEIARLFAAAQKAGLFEAKSHMMQNDREFFACGATTYLFGVTAQEPFTRAKLKEKQPAFFEFLARLFGPNAGTFQGSLTRATEDAAKK